MSDQTTTMTHEEQLVVEKVERSKRLMKKARFKKNMSNPSWVFWALFKYMTLILASFAVLVPPYSVLMASFKTLDEYYNTSKVGLPETFMNFTNYIKVFTDGDLGLAFLTQVQFCWFHCSSPSCSGLKWHMYYLDLSLEVKSLCYSLML